MSPIQLYAHQLGPVIPDLHTIRAMRAHPVRRNASAVDQSQSGGRYRIRIRGVLSETLQGAFPELEACPQGGETLLVGVLPDQPALYGVLAEIEALGLELLEVKRE